jgi:uncharacterized protein (DUF1501 family)
MALTPQLAAARRSLTVVAHILEGLEALMQDLQTTLPATEAEADLGDVDELDPTTEVRAVIDCVLGDWIGPAIRDLRTVVAETEPTAVS